MRRAVVIALASALLVAGCGADKTSAPPPATTQTGSAAALHSVKIYFVKGEQFHPVHRELTAAASPPTGAVEALLAGPTDSERTQGIDTTLPAGTTLDSVEVKDGLATVELSHAQTSTTAFDVSVRPARAAQIVYTLTAISGIKHVLIRVNGTDRARFEDYRTSQAVLAFQAWEGLGRDGSVGPQTLAALETASPPKPATTGTGRHLEVYRAKGVTLLVDGSEVTRAIHTSSGAPGYETPAGSYSIFRKELNSWSYPYQVWLPYASYFNGGIAFHEYADVPPQPASHGCVRVPAPEATVVYEFAAMGTPVTVY